MSLSNVPRKPSHSPRELLNRVGFNDRAKRLSKKGNGVNVRNCCAYGPPLSNGCVRYHFLCCSRELWIIFTFILKKLVVLFHVRYRFLFLLVRRWKNGSLDNLLLRMAFNVFFTVKVLSAETNFLQLFRYFFRKIAQLLEGWKRSSMNNFQFFSHRRDKMKLIFEQ